MVDYKCPKCKAILTPWDEFNFVCDCCGYGKDSFQEFNRLQKILKTKEEKQVT